MALTRDGQFAACGRGNILSVYHLPSRQLVAQLGDPALDKKASHLDLVQSLDFNPEGTLLASGAFREIKLWRRTMDSKTFQLTDVSSNAVFDLAPDGRSIAVSAGTNQISIRDARSNAERRRLVSAEGVSLLKFSADSAKLASIASGTVLEIWNVKDGSVVAKTNLTAKASEVGWIDSATLAIGASNIELWAISDAKAPVLAAVKTLSSADSPIAAIAGRAGGRFSPRLEFTGGQAPARAEAGRAGNGSCDQR